MNKTNLVLASTSSCRIKLLTDAGFRFITTKTSLQKEIIDHTRSAFQNTLLLSQQKAAHIILPAKTNTLSSLIIVITADTLIASCDGTILAKPHDEHEARTMLAQIAQGVSTMLAQIAQGVSTITTGVTLTVFEWSDHTASWTKRDQKSFGTESRAIYRVPQDRYAEYFLHLPEALFACGACIAEGYGSQFLEHFEGSYSGALGLPLYELKKELSQIGFKDGISF